MDIIAEAETLRVLLMDFIVEIKRVRVRLEAIDCRYLVKAEALQVL